MKSSIGQRLRLALIHVITPLTFGWGGIFYWFYFRKTDYEMAHSAINATLWFVSFSILVSILSFPVAIVVITTSLLDSFNAVAERSTYALTALLPIVCIAVSWGSGMIAAIFEIGGKGPRYPLPGRRATGFVEGYFQRKRWMLGEKKEG